MRVRGLPAFAILTWAVFCALSLPLLVPADRASAGEVIYRYLDENGTPNFTERLDAVPLKYQNTVQALDATTFEPVPMPQAGAPPTPTAPPPQVAAPPEAPPPSAVSDATAPAQAQGDTMVEGLAPQALQAQAAPAEPSWLDGIQKQFETMNLPVPTQFQLGVIGTAVALIVGGFLVMRTMQNMIMKSLVRLGIMLVIGGAVYLMYFSGMNEQMSQMTKESAKRTITGKELMGEMKGTLDKTLANNPVQGVIEKTKAATVGQAQDAVTQANQSTQDLQKRLQEIERNP